MVITDIIYTDIRDHIAKHQPERGGALYGPRNYPFVTHFEFDPNGLTSEVSYVPSTQLIGNVPRVERETGLQFKGIVHSHPRGLTRPSGGDEQTVGSFFRMNPHFSQIALPIVQQSSPQKRGGDDEESTFLYWYRAARADASEAMDLPRFSAIRSCVNLRRSRSDSTQSTAPLVRIFEEDFYVLPVRTHMVRLIEHLERRGTRLELNHALQPLKVRNAELVGLIAREASASQSQELLFFVSIDYPIVPPVVLRQIGGITSQVRFHWTGFDDEEAGLVAIANAFADPTESPVTFGASYDY